MSSESTHIAIAGVNGRLGTLIATYLLEFPNVIVHGFCRSPEKVEALLKSNKSFKLFSGSADNLLDLRKAVAGCNTVICAYNTPMDFDFMLESQKLLVEACDAEGVSRYFASDYTGNYRNLKLGDLPLKDPMIKFQKYLEEGNENGTIKVKGVHVLTGGFVEAFFFFFFKPEDPRYWGSGTETWCLTTYETTARYTAHAAVDKSAPTGFLQFVDFQTNIKEIAAMIGKVKGLGGPLPLIYEGTLAEAKEKVEAANRDGNWMQHLQVICHYWFQTSFQLEPKFDNDRYPSVTRISLEDAIKRYVK